MKKLMCTLLLLALLPTAAMAEFSIVPLGTYGGSGTDLVMDGIALADGGFLLVGSTLSNDGDVADRVHTSQNYSDAFAVRTDAAGEVLWTLLMGDTENAYEQFGAVSVLPDGQYLLTYWYGAAEGEHVRAFVVDDTGAIVDEWTMPEGASQVLGTGDGLLAITLSDVAAQDHAFEYEYLQGKTLTRIDTAGETVFTAEMPDLLPMRIISAIQDGETLWLIGDWREAQPYSGAVVAIGGDGEIVMQEVLPAENYGGLKTAVLMPDGGLVAGGTLSTTMDGETLRFYGHAVSIGPEGSVRWERLREEMDAEMEFHSALRLGHAFGDSVPSEDSQRNPSLAGEEVLLAGSYHSGDGSGENGSWLWLLNADGETVQEGFVPVYTPLLLQGADGTVYLAGHDGDDMAVFRVEGLDDGGA